MLKLNVNNKEFKVEAASDEPLLWVIRDRLAFTGTKFGCGIGECGACTVLVEGKPTLSCLTLIVEMEGKEIVTIEGLATNGKLTPLQQTFVDEGAVQCGFCTPGMLMSATALLNHNPHPTEQQIRSGLAGNLCRCTGYAKIIRAVLKST